MGFVSLIGGAFLDVSRGILVCVVNVLGKSSTKVLLNVCTDRGKYACHIYDVIVMMFYSLSALWLDLASDCSLVRSNNPPNEKVTNPSPYCMRLRGWR